MNLLGRIGTFLEGGFSSKDGSLKVGSIVDSGSGRANWVGAARGVTTTMQVDDNVLKELKRMGVSVTTESIATGPTGDVVQARVSNKK